MTVSTNGSTTAEHPTQTMIPTQPRARSYANFLDDFSTWAQENHIREESKLAKGPVMPSFPRLAETLGGYIEPGAHYLSAVPGIGKTALVNQLAGTCGCPALIVTTEMNMHRLFLRQISRITSRPLGELNSGVLSPAAMMCLARETIKAIPGVFVLDATACVVSLPDIQSEIRATKDETTGHLLLIVDSVHSLARRNAAGSTEYERITQLTNDFERLVNAENIAAVLVAERSRATMKTGGLHAAKGSASVEYTGAGVWSLGDGAGDGTRNSDGSINLTLTVEKNRNGPKDVAIPFKFFSEFMNFIEE